MYELLTEYLDDTTLLRELVNALPSDELEELCTYIARMLDIDYQGDEE